MAKNINARRIARRIIFISLGLLISIPLVIFISLAIGSIPTGSTDKMEEIANKFQPGPEWTLTSERIEPPRNVCFEKCNEVRRTWNTDTKSSLHNCSIIKNFASQFTSKQNIINKQRNDDQDPDKIISCSTSFTVESYTVELIYNLFTSDDKPLIILQVN